MKQVPASRKLNEQAREHIASILLTEISDPRLAFVTVTGAEVSMDRSVMNVFVSTEPDRYDEVLAAFESAKGRIRSELGRRITWRVTPELRFFLDTSIDEAQRISEALQDVPPTLAAAREAGLDEETDSED